MKFKISFTGDLMVLLPELKASQREGIYDFAPVFSKVKETLSDSDYVIGNLETPIANCELGYTSEATVFNTPKEFVKAAKDAGFSCFTLANNHCLDRGIPGLNQTLRNLRMLGVDFLGAYDSIEESKEPLIKEIGGKKFAFLSYTYGTNSAWRNNKLDINNIFRVDLIREQEDFNNVKVNPKVQIIKRVIKAVLPQLLREKICPIVIPECVKTEQNLDKESLYFLNLKKKIEIAKEKSDYLIMLLHCGGQYNNEVGAYTRNVCTSLVELGCDLIVVNHPHCVLPYEYINNKLVLYALGNFCFTPNYGYYYKGVYADYSMIFNLYFDNLDDIQKSVSVCKVVKQKNGHSIVYPLYNLILESKGKKKESLIKANNYVLARFLGVNSTQVNYAPAKEYFF